MRTILTWLFFRVGWKVSGALPSFKKYVIAVAPHTSGWDFVIGIMARSALKIESSHYLGKSQLFRPPFGWIFRALGGTPVDRSTSNDVVDQVVEIFNKHDEFVLALAPEGTRKKVGKLKTGFYYIARGAKVPIVPVGFDFERKMIVISEALFPTENFDLDMETLLTFYKTIKGKIPELGL